MSMNIELRILIVEDDEIDAQLLERVLKKTELNFITEVVQTREAFEIALDEFNPDIIISDFSLPSFDGARAFRIKQDKKPLIPFIIISGSLGEENAVELIKCGVTDFVPKDKLFQLGPKITRALKESEEVRAKEIAVKKLKVQNRKLLEIAQLQSHQIRVPVVHILGLYDLFNFDDFSDPGNAEVIRMLKMSAESLDSSIMEITQKIDEIYGRE